MHAACVYSQFALQHDRVFLFPAQQRLNTHYGASLSLLSVLSARTAGAARAVVDANVDHIACEGEAQRCGIKTE